MKKLAFLVVPVVFAIFLAACTTPSGISPIGTVTPPPSIPNPPNPLDATAGLIQKGVSLLITIAFILMFVYTIFAGFRFVTASGDSKAIAAAWNQIYMGMIGMVVVVGAYAIIVLIEIFFGVQIISGGLLPTVGPISPPGPAPAATTCTYAGSLTPTTGSTFTITYKGFAVGENIILASRLSGATIQTFGTTTPDSQTTAVTSPSFTYTAGAGGYSVLVQTRFPITNTKCADVDIAAAPPPPVPCSGDTDCDGFSDVLEAFMGTNPNLACGVNAWPPDFNDDKAVNILDQQMMGSKAILPYDKRYDLNGDGKVNSTDQLALAKLVGKTCI